MVMKVTAVTEKRHNDFYVGGISLLEELEKADHSEKEKFVKDFNQQDKSDQIKKEKAQDQRSSLLMELGEKKVKASL